MWLLRIFAIREVHVSDKRTIDCVRTIYQFIL